MKLVIEIELDNDAFGEKPEVEVWDILTRWASGRFGDTGTTRMLHLFNTHEDSVLRDSNGNTVGSVKIEGSYRCDECSARCTGLECAFCEGTYCPGCSAPGDHEDCLEDNG